MTPIVSIILILLPPLFTTHTTSRRILHQPFFPATDPPPPPPSPPPQTTTQPPSPSPSPLPKQPFSSITPTTPTHHHNHNHPFFFPLSTTPPTTTTTVPSTTLPTFPANISSITLPSPQPSSKSHVSKKLLFLSLSLSLLSILFISTMVATFLYHHHKPQDDNHLLPPNHPTSDKPPPPPSLPPNSSTPSSEFLYLGTLFSPMHNHANTTSDFMGSPELHPLPPLVRKVHGNVEEEKVVVAPPPPPAATVAAGGGGSGSGVKLKGLHWDKVRGSSDKAMVWDQFKFRSSFRVNEEMMETLFTANSSKPVPNHRTNQPMSQPVAANMNQKIRVLDPHKSRNIAILLRAFNLTIDEVCESILQGNVDTLGSELLGSLLKMTPTVDEEIRLKELNDTSLIELDPAEKFLKAVIDIPFAFKRVDAMLYMSNFDTEVEYLKASFETIKSACRQLKNSRMFIRLLEAVLMAGNRMNIGTNRGDARAFKLDTLLKLIDIKGTDGKTTLLHFVVHEIAKAEGNLSGFNQQFELYDEVESRKRGLEVVSSLSGELSSVKKAATIDYNVLSKEVRKLTMGLTKIHDVVALNEPSGTNDRFLDSMNMFIRKAEDDIAKTEDEERVSILMVKDITEYFHGTLTMEEENQPLWIFIVVRDFLLVLDRVCKEVGKINERTTVGSQSHPSVFPSFNGRRGFSSF